jgi:colicin import membrane protein
MRPKFVLALLVSALLVIGLAVFLKPHRENAAPPPVEAAPAQPASPAVAANVVPPPLPLPAPVAPAPRVLTEEERQAASQAEIDRLQEWERNDDPQSLSNILADLTNSEKQVREAAIEATKQFGSTNAIPALKAAALSSPDAQEQIDLLEAANFLTLTPASDPSLQAPKTPEEAQSAAEQRARDLAHQQARAQAQAQAQQPNAPPAPSQPAGN